MRVAILSFAVSLCVGINAIAADHIALDNPYWNCLKAKTGAWCYVERATRPPTDSLKEICLDEREALRKSLMTIAMHMKNISTTQAIKNIDSFLDETLSIAAEGYEEICIDELKK